MLCNTCPTDGDHNVAMTFSAENMWHKTAWHNLFAQAVAKHEGYFSTLIITSYYQIKGIPAQCKNWSADAHICIVIILNIVSVQLLERHTICIINVSS